MRTWNTLNTAIGAAALTMILAPAAMANPAALWLCSGDHVEGMSVAGPVNGKFPANVSWDCFPGGGICNAQAQTIQTAMPGRKTVFQASDWKLEIRTDMKAAADGSFAAHLNAMDNQDDEDQGRGLTIDEDVTCQPGT